MTREFLSSPLLSHPTPMTLQDRIIGILSARHVFEQPMRHYALLEEVRKRGPMVTDNEFEVAVSELIVTGELDTDRPGARVGSKDTRYLRPLPTRKHNDTPELEIPNAD